jgi:two-component system CitB family sensor kinase
LLDNAIEACAPTGGTITVTLTESAAGILIRVADTGPGIPAGAPIFEDGYSTSPSRDTVRRGLGLAMVHRLVLRHGGTITVNSGPGAIFEVVLPVLAFSSVEGES